MRLPRTQQTIRSGIEAGLQVGAQWSIWLNGAVVSEASVGLSRPDRAMTDDTLNLWMSVSKPFTAVAICQLWERGLLHPDDPVAKHLPPFAAGGKERITIRHLLTHTSGFRSAAYNTTPGSWQTIIDQIHRAPIERDWVPGITAGYHTASSWFILAELVQTLDGRPIDRYLREAIFEPLSMHDTWLAIPHEMHAAYGDRIGPLYKTSQGRINPNLESTTAEACARVRPGASVRGPASNIARFYQMLLNHGSLDGIQILSPQTVDAMSARQRAATMDLTFKRIIDWGLGVLINSSHYSEEIMPYGFGSHASRRTYGHGGAESSSAFVDPDRRLAGAIHFNGTPGDAMHQQRIHDVLTALYEDLDLVGF